MRFALFLIFCWVNLSSAQMGLYGDLYLGENKVLAIKNEAFTFLDGIIKSDSDTAEIVFLGSAQTAEADALSHSEVKVSIDTQEAFVFPLGKQDRYLPLLLTEGDIASLNVQLNIGPPNNQSLGADIDQLIPSHYWQLIGDKFARVQLSWDENTQLDSFLDQLEDLLLIGFNGRQWEVIPSALAPYAINTTLPTSFNKGAIVSNDRIDFSQYEALALGSHNRNTSLQISQAITPNGDGINEVWFITNIDRYPNAKIWVYSRWGKSETNGGGGGRVWRWRASLSLCWLTMTRVNSYAWSMPALRT